MERPVWYRRASLWVQRFMRLHPERLFERGLTYSDACVSQEELRRTFDLPTTDAATYEPWFAGLGITQLKFSKLARKQFPTILLLATLLGGCGPQALEFKRNPLTDSAPSQVVLRLGPDKQSAPRSQQTIDRQKQVALAFLSDTKLATASQMEPRSGSTVYIWSLTSHQVWSTGVTQEVSSITVSPDEETVVLTFVYDLDQPNSRGGAVLYDIDSWNEIRTITVTDTDHVAFSNDGEHIIIANDYYSWRYYSLSSRRLLAQSVPAYSAHKQKSSNPTNTPRPYQTPRIEEEHCRITSVGFNGKENTLIFAGTNNTDGGQLDCVHFLRDDHTWDQTLAIRYSYPIMVSNLAIVWGGRKGLSYITPTPYRFGHGITLEGGQGRLQDAAISKDGCLLATGFEDGTITLFDLSTGQRVKSWSDGHNAPAVDMDFSPSGHHLATVDQDGVLLVWETAQYLPKERAACLPKPPKGAEKVKTALERP